MAVKYNEKAVQGTMAGSHKQGYAQFQLQSCHGLNPVWALFFFYVAVKCGLD